jgi:hypothetical protein
MRARSVSHIAHSIGLYNCRCIAAVVNTLFSIAAFQNHFDLAADIELSLGSLID